ncbi:hypothetical protein, partial [Runella aurantiaca]
KRMPQKKRISLKNTTRIGRGLENQSFASDKFMPFFLSLTAMVFSPPLFYFPSVFHSGVIAVCSLYINP